MNMNYSRELKKKVCTEICLNGNSTIKTAEEYNIPLKTLEKWITAFNKNKQCFDPIIEYQNDFNMIDKIPRNVDYNDLTNEELKRELMKKDIEISRLKKGYTVKEGGMENKVFITFCKKNMK